MRLGRRRAEQAASPEASGPTLDLDRSAHATSPELDGPQAIYARILDGRSLWLAVHGALDGVALRLEGASDLIHPTNDAPPVAGIHSIRWRLNEALPPHAGGPEVYELVVLPGSIPLHADPLTPPAPMRTPPAPDGRTQFDLRRRETGALVIRREAVPAHCPVVAVALTEAGASFTFEHLGRTDPRLLLVDGEGRTVSTVSVTDEKGLSVGVVGPDDIPAEQGRHWFLSVADVDLELPLRRARNDNTAPGRSTALPLMWTGQGPGLSLVRFEWQPEGRLRITRRPDGTGPSTGPDDDGDET